MSERNKYGITFNGIRNPYLVTLRGKRRPPWAPLERDIISLPGTDVSYAGETTVKPRVLSIPVLLESNSLKELQKMKEDLAEWLYSDSPKELIFDDEPDRVYYAMIHETFDVEEFVRIGAGMMEFICPDPYKYSTTTTERAGSNTVPIDNKGSVHTYPDIEMEITEPSTFVAVSNGEELNLIGRYGNVDEVPYVRKERVFWDELGTTVGWSNTNSVEEGENTGVMKTSGHSFYTNDYGTGTKWHGPALKKSIGVSVQDFQVDAMIRQIGSDGQVGSVEIALLDVNNRFVAKMTMSKRSAKNQAVWARMRAGTEVANQGHDIMNTRGDYDWVWAKFKGMIHISRIGKVWEASVGVLQSDGSYGTRAFRRWEDVRGLYTAPIAQVQIQVWKHGNTPATETQHIDDVKVFRINKQQEGIPYIVDTGDIVRFDHVNDVITINGEEVMKEKAFAGEYFSIKPGGSAIVAEPSDSVTNTVVRWKDRWR